MNTACGLLVLLISANALIAQESADVRGESPGTRKRLVEAEQKLAAGKATEVRVLIEKIIDDAGDDLILIENGHYMTARRFGQRLLNRLPEAERKLAAERNDAAAKKLLETGLARRDPRPLRELIDRHFVSPSTAEALAALGDLAYERGEFAMAEKYWTSLTKLGDDLDRVPYSKSAEIEAAIILAIRQQEPIRAMDALIRFAKEHFSDRGRIAGQEGNLLERLKAEFEKPLNTKYSTSTPNDWWMLGGDVNRSGAVAGNLHQLPPQPSVTLPLLNHREPLSPYQPVRRVSHHPVYVDGVLHFATNNTVYRLENDKLNPIIELPGQKDWKNADFTLTASNGRLYARMGSATVIANDSEIVCISAKPPFAVLWRVTSPVKENIRGGWEGAPLVANGNAYAAYSRIEGGRLITAVAGLDVTTGKPLFTVDLCESSTLGAETRDRHELLMLAGDNIVFVSQTGVIAAVNAETGKRAWSVRYPRINRVPFDGRHRDLSPAVYSDGRVFVAPNDSDRLLALDAESGKLLWQSPRLLVDHILGVADGKVVASIAGPQRGLRAFGVRNGSTDFPHGWLQHDDPYLATFGRGLIVKDIIAWPTQAGLYLIRLQDGLPAKPMLKNLHGNVAYAEGKLAVISTKTLWLFEPAPNIAPIK